MRDDLDENSAIAAIHPSLLPPPNTRQNVHCKTNLGAFVHEPLQNTGCCGAVTGCVQRPISPTVCISNHRSNTTPVLLQVMRTLLQPPSSYCRRKLLEGDVSMQWTRGGTLASSLAGMESHGTSPAREFVSSMQIHCDNRTNKVTSLTGIEDPS